MNIFVLDVYPEIAAKYHCDKHVVKMITETAQLLSSAYYYTDEHYKAPYRISHEKHPCSIWARYSMDNWVWLARLGFFLYEEYVYRYGDKVHRAGEVILSMIDDPPVLPYKGLTMMPLCMPEECKIGNVVESYRCYYLEYKKNFLNYTRREVPYWVREAF